MAVFVQEEMEDKMLQHDAHVFDWALNEVEMEWKIEQLRKVLMDEGLTIGEPYPYDPYRDLNECYDVAMEGECLVGLFDE